MLNLAMVRVVGLGLLGAASLVSPTAEAAKPGAGGTDPCASGGLDFPAFVYRSVGGRTYSIYVTDSQGKCKRVVTTSSASITKPKFSYPVDGTTNRGRVVFLEGTGSIYAVDFTVGVGNSVTSDPKRLLLTTSGCCTLDLSRDGATVYFSDTDTSLARVPVAAPVNPERIYTLPSDQSSWFFLVGSVNGDETQYFATRAGFGSNEGRSQLVRIDMLAQTEILLREWLPQPGYGANPFWPSADKYTARVAFNEYNLNTNNCSPLTVTDYAGNELFPASFTTERVGRDPTWVGNDVVMQRRLPMNGSGKCDSSTSISMIDLDSNAETELVTGNSPDGR